jgi:ribosomal protein S18 acetylase RimI-like enzyme
MGPSPLRLRRATKDDYNEIITLIDEAAEWLRTKNTDQWAQPWPSEEDRRVRILRDLIAGKTLIVSDQGLPVATITADLTDNPIWPPDTRQDPAVYVCRLVVRRSHGGQGIGSALLDWVGLRARQRNGAAWVRVDVWTTNEALHAYYQQQGFEFCKFSDELDDYPSTALFQKDTTGIIATDQPLFVFEPWSDYPDAH